MIRGCLRSIAQLRVPVRAASLGRQIEDRPQRRDVRRIARILARIGHVLCHLACPEQPHRVAIAPVDDERSEEHTSELQSPYVISSAVFYLQKKYEPTMRRP